MIAETWRFRRARSCRAASGIRGQEGFPSSLFPATCKNKLSKKCFIWVKREEQVVQIIREAYASRSREETWPFFHNSNEVGSK